MKPIKKPIIAIIIVTIILSFEGITSLSGSSPHHDHHDHSHDHKNHSHDHHESTKITPGPNEGRIISATKPPFEFLVTAERKVKITFLNDNNQPIPTTSQRVALIGGNRFKPTELKFSKSGDILISDKSLPEGSKIPVILIIQISPDSKVVRERFNLDLNNCSNCSYKKYACES